MLETLSRGLRTFLPISISGTSPPAPRRRPLSFGGAVGGGTRAVPAFAAGDAVQRVVGPGAGIGMGAGHDDGEEITWAGWDEVGGRRVLLVAYGAGGLQMWDTGDLGAVRELLNLRTESLHGAGPVLCAAVLRAPEEGADEFAGARPLLGVLCVCSASGCSCSALTGAGQIMYTSERVLSLFPYSCQADFFLWGQDYRGPTCIYCYRTCSLVPSLPPSRLTRLQATTNPHMLHILSSRTLSPLHTIALATPPVFALSLRLLAYASASPISHAHGPPAPTFVARTRDSLGSSVVRVGGEVWSGVKAAVAASAAGLGGTDHDEPAWGFSRSAPAASSAREQWMRPPPAADGIRDDTPHARSGWVTVVDLMPLLSGAGAGAGAGAGPRRLACFAPFPPEPAGIAHLAFAGVGATPIVCVAPRDGQRVAVFQIRPGGAGPGAPATPATAAAREPAVAEMPWHWYDLRRGVTSARVDSVVWEKTGRWVGVATGRRTVRECRVCPWWPRVTHLGSCRCVSHQPVWRTARRAVAPRSPRVQRHGARASSFRPSDTAC